MVRPLKGVTVHLLGHYKHPEQPYTGKYDVKAKECIVPVAKAILVAAPQGGSSPTVPSGCVLVRRVQRLTYGGTTVCVPRDGFGLRLHVRGAPCEELEQGCDAGGEKEQHGFVALDVREDGQYQDSLQDATHMPPDQCFLVPEWWVQPASYFKQAQLLGHYNDPDCATCHKNADMCFLCDSCPRIYHAACMSAERLRATQESGPWHCSECSTHWTNSRRLRSSA